MEENKFDYFLDENGNPINPSIDEVGLRHVGKPKSKKAWYRTTDARDYITGNSNDTLFGKGAKSLERAARDYQYLANDFSRHQYSPKFMARKYDKFGGIDLELIDLSRKKAEEEYNSARMKFESGEISEREWKRISQKTERTLNNLNENYKSLYEVWHGRHDIPLVRTQSSVSPLPFVLGSVGVPLALIGAPGLLKFMSNPIVQAIGTLTGLYHLATDQGVEKTYNHFKNGEYWDGVKSLAGDLLDAAPLIGVAKGLRHGYNVLKSGKSILDTTKTIGLSTDTGKAVGYVYDKINDFKPGKFNLSNTDDLIDPSLMHIDVASTPKIKPDPIKEIVLEKPIRTNEVLNIFEQNPDATILKDPHHNVQYVKNLDGTINIEGDGFSQVFNQNDVLTMPFFGDDYESLGYMTNWLYQNKRPNGIVLTGNAISDRSNVRPILFSQTSDLSNVFELSNGQIAIRNPIINNLGISTTPKINDIFVSWGNTARVPYNPRRGWQNAAFEQIYPKSTQPNQELTSRFIDFVKNYPDEELESMINLTGERYNRNMYSHFGLDVGRLGDDIYEKAEKIARKTSMDQAKNVPEITLVNSYGNATNYNYYRNGELIGNYDTTLQGLENGPFTILGQESNNIKSLNNKYRGVSRQLYDSALDYGNRYFENLYGGDYKGIFSGEMLLSPEQTLSVTSKPNFSTELIGNWGIHHYGNGQNVIRDYPGLKLDINGKPVLSGLPMHVTDAPVTLIKSTTDPSIPLKVSNLLNPNRIIKDVDGSYKLLPFDLNSRDLYKVVVPILGAGAYGGLTGNQD